MKVKLKSPYLSQAIDTNCTCKETVAQVELLIGIALGFIVTHGVLEAKDLVGVSHEPVCVAWRADVCIYCSLRKF